jgi:catechol 2,3-dioxygenase-like lactoylglutathione lyase family enzyme
MFRNTKAVASFSVDDLPKAKAFYSEILGMDVSEENGILYLNTAGDKHLMIYPKPNHTPATYTILNFSVDNIEQTVDELTRLGVRFEHYEGDIQTDEKGIARGNYGPNMAWFKDPAGNILSVVEET